MSTTPSFSQYASEPVGSGRVRFGIVDSVAYVILNDPDTHNAISPELAADLHEAVDRCTERTVRSVILAGEGPSFCSGGQVKTITDMDPADLPAFISQTLSHMSPVVETLATIDAPVIGAVHGNAIGGGMSLAGSCDLLIAAESARFMVGFTRVAMGLELGLSLSLPQMVGQRRALDLVLTNRAVTGSEAVEMGLANRSVADEQLVSEAVDLAGALAAGPLASFGEAKRGIRNEHATSLSDRIEYEYQVTLGLAKLPDAHEGFTAIVEKRRASYVQ